MTFLLGAPRMLSLAPLRQVRVVNVEVFLSSVRLNAHPFPPHSALNLPTFFFPQCTSLLRSPDLRSLPPFPHKKDFPGDFPPSSWTNLARFAGQSLFWARDFQPAPEDPSFPPSRALVSTLPPSLFSRVLPPSPPPLDTILPFAAARLSLSFSIGLNTKFPASPIHLPGLVTNNKKPLFPRREIRISSLPSTALSPVVPRTVPSVLAIVDVNRDNTRLFFLRRPAPPPPPPPTFRPPPRRNDPC